MIKQNTFIICAQIPSCDLQDICHVSWNVSAWSWLSGMHSLPGVRQQQTTWASWIVDMGSGKTVSWGIFVTSSCPQSFACGACLCSILVLFLRTYKGPQTPWDCTLVSHWRSCMMGQTLHPGQLKSKLGSGAEVQQGCELSTPFLSR